MALTPETGAGLADADSYCSQADADAYHDDRGNAAWALLDSDAKDAALRKATDYMVQSYRSRWSGLVVLDTQALDWPRCYVRKPGRFADIASDVVPPEVINACAELALKASAGELTPDTAQEVKERTVGPITTVYADGSRSVRRFTAVDRMLSGLFGGSGIRIERA